MDISREELLNMSNDKLLALTKDHGVDFYCNGQEHPFIQLSLNDLEGFGHGRLYLFTKTGIKIYLKDIDYMKII